MRLAFVSFVLFPIFRTGFLTLDFLAIGASVRGIAAFTGSTTGDGSLGSMTGLGCSTAEFAATAGTQKPSVTKLSKS